MLFIIIFKSSIKFQMLFQYSMCIFETRRECDEKMSNFVNITFHYFLAKDNDLNVFQIINDLEIFCIIIVLKLFSNGFVRFDVLDINDDLLSSIKSISCFFYIEYKFATCKNIFIDMLYTKQMIDLRINYLYNFN